MKLLEMRLRRAGLATKNWGYSSLRGSISEHAKRLQSFLQELHGDTSISQLYLVTHSMGGIVARGALKGESFPRLRRMVMLGPPNRGSHAARILAPVLGRFCQPLVELSDGPSDFLRGLHVPRNVELGIIAAAHDRVVSVQSTHLDGETDHVVLPSGHGRMLFRSDVAQNVISFLRYGQFAVAAPQWMPADATS
jgi:pimeloyl-ACP methyl ester carboxylesterase